MLPIEDLLEKIKLSCDELTLIELCHVDIDKLVDVFDYQGIIEEYRDDLEEYIYGKQYSEEY